MATLNSVNYAKTQNNQKIDPAEMNGRMKGMHDSYTLPGVVLAANDEVNSSFIPEGAIITNAWIKSPSLGTTGILQMGLRAHVDEDGAAVAEDPDGLVASADAGGQAVFQNNGTEDLIGSKIGKGGAQVFLKCTEVSTLTAVKFEWHVEYLLPS